MNLNNTAKVQTKEQLAAYFNWFVSQEMKAMCPFWHASVVGACGVHNNYCACFHQGEGARTGPEEICK